MIHHNISDDISGHSTGYAIRVPKTHGLPTLAIHEVTRAKVLYHTISYISYMMYDISYGISHHISYDISLDISYLSCHLMYDISYDISYHISYDISHDLYDISCTYDMI